MYLPPKCISGEIELINFNSPLARPVFFLLLLFVFYASPALAEIDLYPSAMLLHDPAAKLTPEQALNAFLTKPYNYQKPALKQEGKV